jgi:hypothetical protein
MDGRYDGSGDMAAHMSVRVVPVPRHRLMWPLGRFGLALLLSVCAARLSPTLLVAWIFGVIVGSTGAELIVAWRSA